MRCPEMTPQRTVEPASYYIPRPDPANQFAMSSPSVVPTVSLASDPTPAPFDVDDKDGADIKHLEEPAGKGTAIEGVDVVVPISHFATLDRSQTFRTFWRVCEPGTANATARETIDPLSRRCFALWLPSAPVWMATSCLLLVRQST